MTCLVSLSQPCVVTGADILEVESEEYDYCAAKSNTFCLETALLLMECSWQSYYVTPRSTHITQNNHKYGTSTQNNGASEISEDSFFSTLLGGSINAQIDVAQYGLNLVKCFCNADGDISGYVATDNCKCLKFLGVFSLLMLVLSRSSSPISSYCNFSWHR